MSGLAGYSFDTPAALAAAAAHDWIELLRKRDTGRAYGVALSGGRISKTFFAAVVEQSRAAALDWSNVHFFWADERCVPPDDPESNYRTAREELFLPLGLAEGQVHRVEGEQEGETAASSAEAEIRRVLAAVEGAQPVLDLIFLGIGEDGHVASLFPGEDPDLVDDPRVYRAVIGPKPPPRRVTLGYAAIAAAREVWILASGAGKEAVYKGLMQRDLAYPVTRVVTGRQYTRLYEDISRRKV